MKKTKQIIVRMTEDFKKDLELIAKENGEDVSKLVRKLVFEYISKQKKKPRGE